MSAETPDSPLLPPALWQGVAHEWLWVYQGVVPTVREWSSEILVPPGVFIVQSGMAVMEVNGRRMRVSPGQAFLSAPGPRRQWFTEQTRLLSVGFRCQWPDGRPVYSTGLNSVVKGGAAEDVQGITQKLFRAVHGRRKEVTYREGIVAKARTWEAWRAHEAAYQSWFAEFAAILHKLGIHPTTRQGAQDRRVEVLVRRLNEWPLDQTLNLESLEAELRLGARRIHQLLREQLGMTAQVYLERRRLETARARLTREDTPLKEIAFSLGFRHPPHFTAWFKRLSGMTPTSYREGRGFEGA